MKHARCVEDTVNQTVYRKVGDKRAHKKNIITETDIKHNKKNKRRLKRFKLEHKKNKEHVTDICYFSNENSPKKHG